MNRFQCIITSCTLGVETLHWRVKAALVIIMIFQDLESASSPKSFLIFIVWSWSWEVVMYRISYMLQLLHLPLIVQLIYPPTRHPPTATDISISEYIAEKKSE